MKHVRQNSRATGNVGEKLACVYLKEKGYRVIKRNFYCSGGEIDVVAKKGDKYFFIEVKLRKGTRYGSALDGISRRKLMRIKKCAQEWCLKNGIDLSLYGGIYGVLIDKVSSVDGADIANLYRNDKPENRQTDVIEEIYAPPTRMGDYTVVLMELGGL